MKRICLNALMAALVLFAAASPAAAEPPETLWSYNYGGGYHDRANGLCAAGDGEFFVTGFTDSHAFLHPSDLWLLKIDADGDTLWTRKYGGDDNDTGNAVFPTDDGGAIVTGATRSFGAGAQPDNLWLLRIDADGDTLWTRTHGGTYYDYGYDLLTTPDGGFLIAGEWGDYGCGSSVWLLKTDADGREIWSRTYGSSYWNSAASIRPTVGGGYIVAGRTEIRVDDAYHDQLWLLQTDAAGDTLWTRRYGGPGADRAHAVRVLADGGLLVAGHTSSFGHGNQDMWVLRTDAVGDTLWTRTYGGTENDSAASLQLQSDGGFVLVGSTNSFGSPFSAQAWLLCCDAAGDTIWTRRYGEATSCTGRALLVATDRGCLVAGHLSAGTYADLWVMRTVADPVGVPDHAAHIDRLAILGAPNPFSGETSVRFTLARPLHLRLEIYDLRGSLVARLADSPLAAGPQSFAWNGRDRDGQPAPSGVYLVRAQTEQEISHHRVVLVR